MRLFFIGIISFFSSYAVSAQVFDIETIKLSGDDNNRINLVILSEGYQSFELSQFITDATLFSDDMFSRPPFQEYAEYFNVYAIKVPSNESGADHPGTSTDPHETPLAPLTPVVDVDTYFNATHDAFGKHRLLYYEIDGHSANNTEEKIYALLADHFPAYDQALILVNTPIYGGSGGEFPMTYNGPFGASVAIHELGHSLFNLKDEYYPGDILAAEATNMTQETDPTQIRWKNWLNTNDIGIYQYTCSSGNCSDWYKPNQNCIMELIDKQFCAVCKEGIVKKIHNLVSSIDSFTPNSNTVNNPDFPISFNLNLIKPTPNTLESSWILNGSGFASNVDGINIQESDLNTGTNTLTVSVTDNSPFLKITNHETIHIRTVTWTIENNTLGIGNIENKTNSFSIDIYPNPSTTVAHFRVESNSEVALKIDVVSMDGKTLKTIPMVNSIIQPMDISTLNTGVYLVNIYADNVLVASKKLIKK